ncbi:sulfite exporter TauE/SafE family protein [Chondrinema litorale]|uniref:sulfite exporter TauE/SafE family protein n=1 Tax=Chondrinema litorale TaxID=2994555 RepID=UPI002543EC19|nr:sulfite exporter TauE/SafE family protein [Chondrinema litorale]UZR98945.1 sulfite exporter TauE/SafE family protein [Chondrinema litorale]
MNLLDSFILAFVGIAAGFLNVVAGGGSLLTLPLLIFMGLPPAMANGTNRVAILLQNVFAINKFRRSGIVDFQYSIYLGLAAIPGAVLGGFLALDIKGEIFNRVLSIIMLVVGLIIVFGSPKKRTTSIIINEKKNIWIGIIVFFFIGVYGGFIHAGVGFFMIFALDKIHSFSMAKINSIKVIVAFIYTLAVLIIFIFNELIHWQIGFALAIGTSLGGWLGGYFSIKKDEKWIKVFLLIAIVTLSIKLWVLN